MALDPTTYPALLPTVTELNRPFSERCRAGELRVQRCAICGTFRLPDSYGCLHCLSEKYRWVALSGRGSRWSCIRMHERYFSGFAEELPYNMEFIQLDNLYMVSAVIDNPADLQIGARLEVAFVQVPGDRGIPKFRVHP